MSPEDEPVGPLQGATCTGDDVAGDPSGSNDPDKQHRAPSALRSKAVESICREDLASGESSFLKILMDAEAAANAASIQLVSFKEALENEFSDSRSSICGKQKIRRQRCLLMEKLDNFKKMNKCVRQRLKRLQSSEPPGIDPIVKHHQVDTLLNKIAHAEGENENLKREVDESERRIEQLMELRRAGQESVKSAVNLTKSLEGTCAQLQAELRNTDVENNRLTVQLQTSERTLAKQNMEINDLKGSISSLTEKAEADKESLRKANRAQKLRAERFEAAVEKCYEQLKQKEAEVAKAQAERESRRRQREQVADEKNVLIAHVELLKSQVADLTSRLQKEKDELAAANSALLQQTEQLTAENTDLSISNEALKASVADLEKQLAEYESALVEEMSVSQERKHQVERWQNQVAELQVEIDDLRIKHASDLKETKRLQEGKHTEAKVRQELQGRVEELKFYLKAAEQRLVECEKRLQHSERMCSEKSWSIVQLQAKMESQQNLQRSSVELKESLQEANSKLRETVNSLHMQLENLQQENLELVRSLAAQEEAVAYSNRQLDQRSTECQAFSRQLEAALVDVRQQVNRVKDQAVSREEALQNKILTLEAEKSRRESELRLLRQSKHKAEKQFEMRLKDLQLSLEQSESHKKSIQSYVDFLKSSYTTMFHEGPQATYFSSSYFR
ncbi:outer dense fiber protein 2-like isoform X1 [Nelusetta ayraudi]|uniref:outer dense fiber protein 2-like isoform X1 n=1 Tax=Nelusetta ayraudi TaxID=303726 RepID=UPI003F6E79A6